MKLVLLVVLAVAIFSADSRDFPDKPDKRDSPDHNSMEERKGNNGIELRGNSGKKALKTLVKKLGSVEHKLNKAIYDMNAELQAIKKESSNQNKKLDSIILYIKVQTEKITTTPTITTTETTTPTTITTTTAPTLTSNAPTTTRNTTGLTLFGGQYLTFSTERVSWDLANKSCESNNARLAVVNPQAFHTYLSSKYRGQYFWLGATDKQKEGTWTWLNSTPFSKFPWGPNEPNDSGGEDCLEWGHAGNYNDETCTSTRRYVCEYG